MASRGSAERAYAYVSTSHVSVIRNESNGKTSRGSVERVGRGHHTYAVRRDGSDRRDVKRGIC